MKKKAYYGELIFSSHEGEMTGQCCEVEARDIESAEKLIESELSCRRPKAWLRILEDGEEVLVKEVHDSRGVCKIGVSIQLGRCSIEGQPKEPARLRLPNLPYLAFLILAAPKI